jgi:hypothetical protein
MEIEIISQAEYDIYSAICQEKSLFLFDRADTIFDDFTGDCPFQEYRRIEPRFTGEFKYKCKTKNKKGMVEDYEIKNANKWQLEKRFQVKNGYRWLSEVKAEELTRRRNSFTLSRVGFSESGDYGLAHIASSACGYYLLFHYDGESWTRMTYVMSYS